MGHLFISYSRNDKKVVGKLVSKLEKAGHIVWLDTQDIEGGDQWRSAIVKAIKTGHALIVAISPNSVSSRNVRKELDVAEQASVRIIPVRLSQAAIPDEMNYQLAGTQEIDLSRHFEGGVARLISVLGEDTKVKQEARGRWIMRMIIWAVGGGIGAFMLARFVLPFSFSLGEQIALGLTAGAALGLLSGLLFRLIGWISTLIGWVIVVLGGGVLGALLGEFVLPPEASKLQISAAVGGSILAVICVLMIKKWRSLRMRSKLAALAGSV